jgi:ABC-type ATPase involved in cell division
MQTPHERRIDVVGIFANVVRVERCEFATHRVEAHAFTRATIRIDLKRMIRVAELDLGNLDSNNGRAVMDLLAELHAAGSTICMVTHDPRYLDYAERRIDLFDGRIDSEHVAGEARP